MRKNLATLSTNPRQSNLRWLWFVAGGCALLLLIGAAGAVVGGLALVKKFQQGGFACLPSDFPSYPGATITFEKTYVGTGLPAGDTSQCQQTLDSNDDVATVTEYYAGRLDTDDWRITSNDTTNGVIKFARRSRPQTAGTVELLGRGQHTSIQVKLDS
jgi:hypothetical protein